MKKIISQKSVKATFCLIVLFGLFLPNLATAWEWGGDRNWGREAGLPEGEFDVTVVKVVQWFLSALSLFAIVMIIIGGYTWMTAGGNEEKIKKAKSLIQTTIIGLVIILFSWAIFLFVVNTVIEVSTT